MRRVALLLALVLVPAAAATPPPRGITHAASGEALYAANCSRCHGSNGRGLTNLGPSLAGSGALGVDFYLRTGYMPLDHPNSEPYRSRVLFDERELDAMIAYVASLGHGPAIPHPQWQHASVAAGMRLFTEHCAGCHQIVAQGGYVTGARVPALTHATPRQIAEAVRIGPYLMPRFSTKAITATQLNDLVAYVQYAKHPDDRGGRAIGHIGPWPEGMVAWLLGAAALVAVCTLLGRRMKRA
jgi:ubiquinol-cytochrome c reductase cytochrome c subunit